MNTISLKNLYLRGTFKTISPLRLNTNNYPFVTLLTANGRATNIYFGKKTSQLITDSGLKSGDSMVKFLAGADVVQTLNEQQEERFKLSINTGEYSSAADMEEAFVVTTNTEFDVKAFETTFASLTPATVTA